MGGKLMKYIKNNGDKVNDYIQKSEYLNTNRSTEGSNINKTSSISKFEENTFFRVNNQK